MRIASATTLRASTNEVKEGNSYYHETHGFMSMPVYVRENTLLAQGAVDNKPEYEYNVGTKFLLCQLQDGAECEAKVTDLKGNVVYTLKASRCGKTIAFVGEGDARDISVTITNVAAADSSDAAITKGEKGVVVVPNDVHHFTVELN